MNDSSKTLIIALVIALFSVTGLQVVQFLKTNQVLGEQDTGTNTCRVGIRRCIGRNNFQVCTTGNWADSKTEACPTNYICSEGYCVKPTNPTPTPVIGNDLIPCREIHKLAATYCRGNGTPVPTKPKGTSTPVPTTPPSEPLGY